MIFCKSRVKTESVLFRPDLSSAERKKSTKKRRFPSGKRRSEMTCKLLTAETLVEAFNTSASVDQLLLTSVEGMALGANFDVDLGFGGTSLDDVAACTSDGAVNVVRMDTLFHSFHLISGSDLLGPYYKCMCPSQPSISATPASGLGNDCFNIIAQNFANARANAKFSLAFFHTNSPGRECERLPARTVVWVI